MIFILHQLDTKSIKSGQYDHETKCRLNSIGDRSGIRTTLATTILCRTLVTDRTTTTSEELLTNANRLNDRALNNVFPPCRSLFICVSWAVSLFSQPRAFSVSVLLFDEKRREGGDSQRDPWLLSFISNLCVVTGLWSALEVRNGCKPLYSCACFCYRKSQISVYYLTKRNAKTYW